MARSALALKDQRSVTRDDIHYRARAICPNGSRISLLIVNISAMGLMARIDDNFAEGDQLTVQLPVVGSIKAEVRWSLGGRIGCELEKPIDLADYYDLLATLIKPGRN